MRVLSQRCLLLVWLVAWPVPLLAQDQAEVALDYSLASPYDAIVTHLGFLQRGNYHPTIAALTFAHTHRTRHEAKDLAIKLKHFLEVKGVHIDVSQIPRAKDYIDPKAKYHRYLLTPRFPEIYLVRIQGQWRYSEETVQYVSELAQARHPLGLDQLKHFFPDSFDNTVLGLHLWQYAILSLLLLGLRITYTMLVFFCQKLIRRYPTQWWAPHHVVLIVRPASIALVVSVGILLLPAAQLAPSMQGSFVLLLKCLMSLALTVVCYRSSDVLVHYLSINALDPLEVADTQLFPLIRTSLKVVIVIIGTLIALRSLNFDISTLLAGVSIGGFGIALAAQDTIKNLFGSLVIFTDKPFSTGESIIAGKVEGTVEEIGMRSTRVRTASGSVIAVPNAVLANTSINNHGLHKSRQFCTRLSVAYDTPAQVLADFLAGLSTIVEEHPQTNKDEYYVYVEDLQGDVLRILLHVYLVVADRHEELQCRQAILQRIVKLATAMNMQLHA